MKLTADPVFILGIIIANFLTVLHCLRSRFHTGAYSTSAGITLIAVNPFREVKGCYGEEAVQRYREGAVKVSWCCGNPLKLFLGFHLKQS